MCLGASELFWSRLGASVIRGQAKAILHPPCVSGNCENSPPNLFAETYYITLEMEGVILNDDLNYRHDTGGPKILRPMRKWRFSDWRVIPDRDLRYVEDGYEVSSTQNALVSRYYQHMPMVGGMDSSAESYFSIMYTFYKAMMALPRAWKQSLGEHWTQLADDAWQNLDTSVDDIAALRATQDASLWVQVLPRGGDYKRDVGGAMLRNGDVWWAAQQLLNGGFNCRFRNLTTMRKVRRWLGTAVLFRYLCCKVTGDTMAQEIKALMFMNVMRPHQGVISAGEQHYRMQELMNAWSFPRATGMFGPMYGPGWGPVASSDEDEGDRDQLLEE